MTADLVITKLEILPVPLSADPGGSMATLKRLCASIEFAKRADVYFRVLLGKQLLIIQQKFLWQNYILYDGNRARTWDDWVERGFPQVTGFSGDVAFAAVSLARSPTFRDLPPEKVARFKNLSNAIELARFEKHNGRKAPAELAEQAATEPVKQFRRRLGAPNRVPVQVLADGQEKADIIERIMKFLRLADVDALLALEETTERARMISADNPSDCLYAIHAACQRQWDDDEAQGAQR